MKAVIQTRYGSPDDVLELREIERPVPQQGEVLVRVRAASVHADIWHVVTGRPRVLRLMGSGLFRPKNPVPGTDLAGEVEQVGQGVTDLKPGDAVFGESSRGMQWLNAGAFAEYATVPRDNLALKPAGVTFEQAATVPTSGFIALLNLRNAVAPGPGQSILVNGAGGGVGSIALQYAKALGARVTAVDGPKKLDMLRSLGADAVIDYTREGAGAGDERYDLVLDVASTLTLAQARRLLKPTGKYQLIGHDHYGRTGRPTFGELGRFLRLTLLTPFSRVLPKLDFSMPTKKEVMSVLREHLETHQLTPLVDRTFGLDAVPQALRHLAEGEPLGKVVVVP